METLLKTCPFCGRNVRIKETQVAEGLLYELKRFPECLKRCPANSIMASWHDKQELIDSWNKRAKSYEANAIDDYAKDMGFGSTFGISLLIDSHRHLREMNIQKIEDQNKLTQELHDAVVKRAREEVMNGEYINIMDLRKMTISELSEFLNEQGREG